MSELRPSVRIAALLAAVVALGTTVVAVHYRGVRAGDRELLRIGLEDVARRVRTTTANLATITEMGNASLLAKARSLSRLIEKDPSLVKDHARFAALCGTLDVDELHVSDGKGILIQCVPESFIGFDMNSADQPRPFMKAITDPSFELVQEPTVKAIDGTLFQYAGVARIDAPGIVQVGQKASRVQEARRLADINEIAASMRIGREGRVTILSRADTRHAAGGLRVEKLFGERSYVQPADVGVYRVLATIPVRGPWIADDLPFGVLCVLDALLALLLLLALTPSLRRILLEHVHSLRVLFAGTKSASDAREPFGAFARTLRSPLTAACALAFVFALGLSWYITSRSARRTAEEVLLSAASDIHDSVADCVDMPLFFVGNAICKHYGSPEKMSPQIVDEVMRRYDIDELNVIDSRGVVVAGAIADLGYVMASNPKSAEFNRLLDGVSTFSQPFRGAIENPNLRRKYVGVAFPPPAKGYIQMGFSESRVKDGIDYWFKDVAVGWHVGEHGFYVVAKSETGEIDSCGCDLPSGATLASIGFDASAAPKDAKTFFTATLCGVKCLCLSEEQSFHRIITALPMSEISGGSIRTVLATAAILLAVFVVVVVFMTRLSDLVSSLKGYIAAEHERQQKELGLARVIQLSSLPTVYPDTERYHIFAKMDPAREVGGDFYDFYTLPCGKVVILVADVSGKGISAALFMMKAKSILKACVFADDDLAAAVAEANARLAENNEGEMFVTAWVAVVDLQTGVVEYVNAGHNPPLVKRVDGSVEWIRGRRSLVLAAMPDIAYHVQSLKLAPGDGLFLYTDGVTEAMNAAGELYGETRLEQALMRSSGDLFLTEARIDVNAFTDGAEQSDDITMLAFDYKG